MRKFALTIAAILVMGSAFGQVWSYDWHGAAYRLPNENLSMKAGFLYPSGYFTNNLPWIDADPTIGVDTLWPIGIQSGFVTKIDTVGNYHWSIALYGQYIELYDVEADADGNVFVVGFSWLPDFDLDPSSNVAGAINGYPSCYFVAAYDQNGNYLNHIEYDPNSAAGFRLAIDSQNNLYFGGQFRGNVDFDFTSGIDTIRSTIYSGYFLSKMNLVNNQYLWTKAFGGTDTLNDGWIEDMEIQGEKIALAGAFQSTNLDLNPWGGGFIVQHLGIIADTRATFISILDTAGNFLDGASVSGKTEDFQPVGVSLAENGSVYLAAMNYLDDDTILISSNGLVNNYIAGNEESTSLIRFDATLAPDWNRVITSSTYCEFVEVACNNDYAYLAGYFYDSLFQIENGSYRNIAIAQVGVAPRTLIGYTSDGALMGIERDSSMSNVPNYAIGRAKGLEIASDGDLYVTANVTASNNAEFDLDPSAAIVSTTVTDTANYHGASYILKLNFNGFVNTQNPEAPAKVVVYPNPTTQALRIDSESPFNKVTLQDLQGRVLMAQTFDDVQSQTLELSTLSSGVYLLTIEGEMGRVTFKVVKQ